MPQYNFGEIAASAFGQGMQMGQKEDQFKKTVAIEEEKMRQESAFKELQMDKLNEQIRIAEQSRLDEQQYRYDALLESREKQYRDDLIAIEPNDRFASGLKQFSAKDIETSYKIPAASIPGKIYVDKKMYELNRAAALEMQRIRTTIGATLDKENAPIKRIQDITNKFFEDGVPRELPIYKATKEWVNLPYVGKFKWKTDITGTRSNTDAIVDWLNRKAPLIQEALMDKRELQYFEPHFNMYIDQVNKLRSSGVNTNILNLQAQAVLSQLQAGQDSEDTKAALEQVRLARAQVALSVAQKNANIPVTEYKGN